MKKLKEYARYFPFLTIKKEWPWRFEGKLVYSLLVYRQNGETERTSAKETKLNRGTVRNKLRLLSAAGLAKKQDNRWVAREPSGNNKSYFVTNDYKWRPWQQQFQSDPFFVPSEKLSLRAAAVYSLLLSLGKRSNNLIKDTSNEHLAVLLGMSNRTVARKVAELEDNSFIVTEQHRDRFGVLLMPIQDWQLDFFARKGKAGLNEYRLLDQTAKVQEGSHRQYKNPHYERLFQLLLEKKVPRKLAIELMDRVLDMDVDCESFRDAIKNKAEFAEQRHRVGASVIHPGHLLKKYLDERLAKRDRRGSIPRIIEEKRPTVSSVAHSNHVRALLRTKEFLVRQFGHLPKTHELMHKLKDVQKWLHWGDVSPLYFLLAEETEITDLLGHSRKWSMEYGDSITDEIREEFDMMFQKRPKINGHSLAAPPS